MFISLMAPESFPLYIASKRGGPATGGQEGDDWLFQKDSGGGNIGAGMSGMHQDDG